MGEVNNKKKAHVVVQVEKCYDDIDLISEEFAYMFEEDIDKLCKKSTQYLFKWTTSCRLVLRRGEVKEKTKDPLRRMGTRGRERNHGYNNNTIGRKQKKHGHIQQYTQDGKIGRKSTLKKEIPQKFMKGKIQITKYYRQK